MLPTRHGLGTQQSHCQGRGVSQKQKSWESRSQKAWTIGRTPAASGVAPLRTPRQEGNEIRGGRVSLARRSESLHLEANVSDSVIPLF